MDPASIAAIEGLTITGIQAGVKLYGELRKNNPSLPPVEDILAEANKVADDVIKKAEAEIQEAQSAGSAPPGA